MAKLLRSAQAHRAEITNSDGKSREAASDRAAPHTGTTAPTGLVGLWRDGSAVLGAGVENAWTLIQQRHGVKD